MANYRLGKVCVLAPWASLSIMIDNPLGAGPFVTDSQSDEACEAAINAPWKCYVTTVTTSMMASALTSYMNFISPSSAKSALHFKPWWCSTNNSMIRSRMMRRMKSFELQITYSSTAVDGITRCTHETVFQSTSGDGPGSHKAG